MDVPARVPERVAASLLALFAFSFAGVARADKEACARAAESFQELRDQSHFLEARSKLLICASAECPKLIRTDCTTWLDELSRNMPSVTIQVDLRKDDKAADLQVSLDGKPLDDKTLGTAIPVDPGKHKIRAVIGKDSVERDVIVATGEKNKAIALQFEAPVQEPPKVIPPGDNGGSKGARSVGPYILGGVGLGGLVVFGVFQALGRSQFSDLEGGCGKTKSCTSDEVSSVRTKFIVSGVALSVGIAALASAVGWFIFDTPSSSSKTARGVFVAPSLQGAEAGYRFQF